MNLPSRAEHFPEPWIPIPSAKLQRWLLAGLFAWQAAIFWIYPIYLTIFRGWLAPSVLDWRAIQQFRAYEFDPIRVELTLGTALAVSSNVAFALVKSPFRGWLERSGIFALYAAALMGALASCNGENAYTSLPFLLTSSLGSLVATYVFWRWIPSAASRRLVHLGETTPNAIPQNRQIRILHLFYLMTAAAILLAMARFIPPSMNLQAFFHEPIDKLLILCMIVCIATLFSWAAFSLALAPGRRVWWLLPAPLLVDCVAFLFTELSSMVVGKPSNPHVYMSCFCICFGAFSFLAGTALTLRLLGYRLMRTKSPIHPTA
jgi:hypothetical protein